MVKDGYVFTTRGYKILQECIRKVEDKLSEATKSKSEAGAGQDTWHDEGFKLGIVDEMMWSKRLTELKKIFLSAQLVQPEEQNEKVMIGVGVIVEHEDGTIANYIIDGYLVKSEDKRISVYSPLGKALLEAKEGDKRVMVIGNRKKVIFLKKIFPPSVAEKIILKKRRADS